jgi:hypothetical protein
MKYNKKRTSDYNSDIRKSTPGVMHSAVLCSIFWLFCRCDTLVHRKLSVYGRLHHYKITLTHGFILTHESHTMFFGGSYFDVQWLDRGH